MWGACWGGGLVAHPSLIETWVFVSTLGGGTEADYGVANGINTVLGGTGSSSCDVSVVDSGVTLGGT